MNTLATYNILLAEDEPLLLKNMKRRIEELNMGFSICGQVQNGKEALDFLGHNNVHVVMTDIIMPVMDGLDLAKNINQKYPSIHTIIVSGYADFKFAQTALTHSVFDYLLKPIESNALADTLTKVRMALSKRYPLDENFSLSGHSSLEIVNYAVAYMRHHYDEPIDLSALSQQLGFSSSYLTKVFNKHTGSTPIKFLTDIRINQAKQLLSNTTLPISQIGEKVGYPDQFYFSKTFRKTHGCSPSAYRDNIIKNTD